MNELENYLKTSTATRKSKVKKRMPPIWEVASLSVPGKLSATVRFPYGR
jgi:hypothetical protein